MRALVVVPTYNERGSITMLLTRLAEEVPWADVLVVDDASPDGTAELVGDHAGHGTSIHLLEREVKDGLGAAYRAGFAWGLDRGYDVLVQMDADLSHRPDQVPALVAALDRADVVVGSRYVVGGSVTEWGLRRRLLSRGGNVYARLVLGLSTHDTTSGFKAFRATALRRIAVTSSSSNGYCFQIESTWRAERAHLRVVEVPITFDDRSAGESKMTPGVVCEALSRVWVWRAEALWSLVTAPAEGRHA